MPQTVTLVLLSEKQKLPFNVIFLLIVDRIKVKIYVLFRFSNKMKKVKYFRFGTFLFLVLKNNENQKLTSIFNF
jgi:hypothetical protein